MSAPATTNNEVAQPRSTTEELIPISEMRVSEVAQRAFRPQHAAMLATEFDMDAFGIPVVNIRTDGSIYLVDGQHRIAALRMNREKYPVERVKCEVYRGLTEAEEAALFLRRDNRRAVPAFEKWRIAQTAGFERECRIAELVSAAGLNVSMSYTDGSIRAVGTLQSIYDSHGEVVFVRMLNILKNAYGTVGFDAVLMRGIAKLLARYGDSIDDGFLIEKLGSVHGGARGLLNRAEVLRKQTGSPKTTCVAAEAVTIHNSGRGGYRLAPWWRARQNASR